MWLDDGAPLPGGPRRLLRPSGEVEGAIRRDDFQGRLSVLVELGPIPAKADPDPPRIGVTEDHGVAVVVLLGSLRSERGEIFAEELGSVLAALSNQVVHSDHRLLPSRI